MAVKPLRIAYLTGDYPRVSHTFIQREIEGVRNAGLTVLPCAIRPPDPGELAGPEEQAAAAETFFVLAAAKNPLRLAAAHFGWLCRAPGRYLSALWLAIASSAPGSRSLLYQLFYFAESGVLADHLRQNRVQHLHNHFADSSCTVAMLTAVVADIPYSFTMHGPNEFFAVERWRLDLKIAQARFVACISDFCRSQLMLFSDPAHWGKLYTIHCGVDLARYDGPRLPAPEGVFRVLSVGRMAAVKGYRVLLEAFAALDNADTRIELTLVGDGPDREALEAEVRARGLEGRVRFTGYLSQHEVAEELRRNDLFVLPSFAEGVPVVLMEAMASRLPVIATRVGGVGELVENGVSGYVVAPGNAEELAAKMSELTLDPSLRTAMGNSGRLRVIEQFTSSDQTALLARAFSHYHDDTRQSYRPV